MPVERINYSDNLKKGTDKLNQAIDDVNSFQQQIDEIVVSGDSSVEAAQARVSPDGTVYSSLRARLDTEYKEVVDGLASKVTKNAAGVITWAMASQDFREQITGGNTAVVGVDAIIEPNIVNGVVTPKKTSFLSQTANLFNKETAILGYYANSGDGTSVANAAYFESDYIPVEAATSYIKSNDVQYALYNESYVFVGGGNTGETTFVNPAITTAKYIKVNGLISEIDSFQFQEGTVLTAYERYGFKVDSLHVTDEKVLNDIEDLKATQNNSTVKAIMSQIILSSTQKKIKLIGDSKTHGVGGTGFAQDGELIMELYGSTSWYVNTNGHCWANSLKDYFESKFNCVVKNYGCTGIASEQMVDGLSQLIDSDDDIVICTIGTNDRNAVTKQTLYNNLVTIHDYVKNLGKDIIFVSDIPAAVANEEGMGSMHMEDIDHVHMKLAQDLGFEYISMFKLFNEYCRFTGVTVDSLLADGLHQNDVGYDAHFYLLSNALGLGTKIDGATW